jgi:hypothetical protein
MRINQFGKIVPIGSTPRINAIHVCDVYVTDADGNEQLIARKYYDKVGHAKSYRTMYTNNFTVHTKYLQAAGRDIGFMNNVPIVNQRCDVYSITPTGYVTIP